MKNKITFILFISFFIFNATNAQLVNNGATITVKNGATLHVDTDVTNTTGTIILESNAILEVSGDFTSEAAASFDANANSTVKFFGSAIKNIKSGGDDFGNVVMNKDADINMTLVDPMNINTNLDFTPANANKLILGANNLTLEAAATITNFDATHYIQADGTGVLGKKYASTGSFTFPVGDVDEYSPIDANVTAGTFGSNASLAVNVVDAVHPNLYTDADAYITRYWNVDMTDITSYAATLTGTYVNADVTGLEANINGASYISDWSFANASGDDVNNTVTGDVSASTDFTGKNFYGKMASLKAYLQGAYSGSTMTTTLNTSGLIPADTPYGTGETGITIPANITDWIKIEIRDAADPSNILKTYSKFIKNDGQIYELDGTSAPKFKDAPTSGYIAIRHRNHLGIRTNSTLDFSTTPSHDFSSGSGQAYGTNPMNEVAPGVWGMWGGNANGDANVRYESTDNDTQDILNAVLNHANNGFNSKSFQYQDYSILDTNMNGYVRYESTDNDTQGILNSVLNHPANGFNSKSYVINEQL